MKRSDITETVLLDALHRYWGYPALRGTQPETIRSVLSGADTLALMPTGGGKSLTYQLPGLVTDGLCIVVSPPTRTTSSSPTFSRQSAVIFSKCPSQPSPNTFIGFGTSPERCRSLIAKTFMFRL